MRRIKLKVSFSVPTHRPDEYFTYFESSLEHIECMLDFCDVEIAFVFQKPWNRNNIELATDNLINKGFTVQIGFDKASYCPSMTSFRNQSFMISSDADFYIVADCNFEFSYGTKQYPYSSGERYIECLRYLNYFQKCGFVMCEGSLGGSVQKTEISSTKTGLFATTRGIVVRNIGWEKLFKDTTHLIGGLEESVLCYHLIEEGFYPAKQFNNPTRHKAKKKADENLSGIHDTNIWANNCGKYICERYNDPDWNHHKKKLPKGLKEILINNFGKEITKTRMFRKDFKNE